MQYQNIIKELHLKLPEYLISQGISISDNGFISCIHPEHPDRNPSCSLNYGNALEGKVFHCFSHSSHDGNIFTAAHWLEKMPIQGQEFWDFTMVELCKRYNLPFEPLKVDEQTRRKYQGIRSNADAARIIHNNVYDGKNIRSNHIGIKHLLDRDITEASIKEWNLGILTSFKDYHSAMRQLGHTDDQFLLTKDLLNKGLFNRNSFIIPVHNTQNQVVGFVNRDCRHKPNAHVNQKYINTITSDIYRKGEILYGYNKCKNVKGPLYIFEGYLDVIYLTQCGLKKATAVGSTTLTEYHINDLLFDKESDIILCLDNDDGGINGTKIAIERLARYTRYNVKIKDLPRTYDPDTYVQEFGLDAFLELKNFTPFEWSLLHSDYSDDLTVVAEKMIPIIASEQSTIGRLRMIRELSNYTAISETDIRKDVDAIISKEDDNYLQEVKDISQYVQNQLNRRKSTDTRSILNDAIGKIQLLDDRRLSVVDMKSDYFQKLNELDTKIKNGDYKYGLLAPKFNAFESTLDGIPYWATMSVVAGRASSGKTALLTDLSIDMIRANSDAAIFFMSIDDSADLLNTKMLAVLTGLSTRQIKAYSSLSDDDKDKYAEAMAFLKETSNRFIVADSTKGNSLDAMENHIRWFCKEFSKQKKVFILDNFHKLSTEIKGQNRKMDMLTDASQRIKTMTQLYDIHIMTTAELRKLQSEDSRPTRQDLQGTNKLDYDCDVVALVHNDYMVNPDSYIIHQKDVNGITTKMPWIELNVAKNKVNGQTNMLHAFKYDSHNMQFTEGNFNEWLKLKNRRKMRGAGDNKPSMF